jgi:hypothetical protein
MSHHGAMNSTAPEQPIATGAAHDELLRGAATTVLKDASQRTDA